MTGQDLQKLINEWQDERDITKTLDQYSYCSDFNDADGLVDCFTEDAEWWSALGLTMRGREEISDWVHNTRNPNNPYLAEHDQGRRGGQHLRTNTQIVLRGDEADVISYFVQLCPDGTEAKVMIFGRYLDHLVRCDDGKWRYKIHRTEPESVDTALHSAIVRRIDSPAVRASAYPSYPWAVAEQ
jgi:ketosteroid isomerase-like protein